MIHNHPSGDPTPSKADIKITRLLRDMMYPLEIIIHDHLIVGKEKRIYSLKQHNLF